VVTGMSALHRRSQGPGAARACERSGKRSGAGRKSGGAERSGAVSGRCRKTMERSGARSGRSRSGDYSSRSSNSMFMLERAIAKGLSVGLSLCPSQS